MMISRMPSRFLEAREGTHNRILLFGDDPHLALLLSRGVASLGLQVERVEFVRPNRETSGFTPCLGVIVDLDMDEDSSSEVIRDMHTGHPHLPIVVVGEERQKYDIIFALMDGATDFLIKPIDSQILQEKCLRLFL